ncbi:hypothetical protein KDA23_03490, partial [Candidatus Saccharibacteria bacterium]|nr:hypothetical protein [Candidatus Saccharibacteria bacterium]
LALELVRSESMFGRSWLVLLERSTGRIQNIPIPSALLSDYAWAPNSHQLFVIGRDQVAPREWVSTVYFLDTLTGDYRIIDSLSGLALGGYRGYGTAWSADGRRLLYRCRLATMPRDVFGVCESTVMIGDVQ